MRGQNWVESWRGEVLIFPHIRFQVLGQNFSFLGAGGGAAIRPVYCLSAWLVLGANPAYCFPLLRGSTGMIFLEPCLYHLRDVFKKERGAGLVWNSIIRFDFHGFYVTARWTFEKAGKPHQVDGQTSSRQPGRSPMMTFFGLAHMVDGVGWGGVGMMTFFGLAHMVDATQLLGWGGVGWAGDDDIL